MTKWLYIIEDASGQLVACVPREGELNAPARVYINALHTEQSAVVDKLGRSNVRTETRELCFSRVGGATLDFSGEGYGLAVYRLSAEDAQGVTLATMPIPHVRVEWEPGQRNTPCANGEHYTRGVAGPCTRCGFEVRCPHSKPGATCQFHNLQCGHPKCLEWE